MRLRCAGALAVALAIALAFTPAAGAANPRRPGPTRANDAQGRFVPIPEAIPHTPGAYIDSRIVRDLAWITGHYRVYVVEGFAGTLPSGETVGCPECHVDRSEHKIGLAVDLAPLKYQLLPNFYDFDVPCDRSWRDVTRLARWAEPSQYHPVSPFRWVGYDGDANHGCGNHLHLSWSHDADYDLYEPSAWVDVFRAPPYKVAMR